MDDPTIESQASIIITIIKKADGTRDMKCFSSGCGDAKEFADNVLKLTHAALEAAIKRGDFK